ncbi:phosphoribosylformylglycinamidine cyclo-ligase [Liquorilactobacillus capillatus]|uniref:Phosphoribosylformylglycinamidine cyclo-ligase n=1 Tax=Liquorilactobacillus capillatus DSM 19910 TaxID=1423731 RepID=A0A0R1M4X8_9LACO|nr:phosphoribosylformylglycinamidine cyclo-ligase [Liquorilactobacillus capillatus]KRL03165.1 phosphoribosylaminoimidazole synthetase [Liquorilactobacillus capillatus DSM 19910]
MSRYQEAGVDVNAGYELVQKIKKDVALTARPGVMGAIGGFGGLFDLSVMKIKEPVLVSGTDGVGTKLMIAQKMKQHDSIGIDCVAMCVNDVLAQGAQPLFFLDYIATGHNDPVKIAEIVHGVAQGCQQAGASLIGGETAEMPDMYAPDEYDLAGFTVGAAEKKSLLTPRLPQAEDLLLGLPSSGLHSNGFSLVRKICFKDNKLALDAELEQLDGKKLGDVLLEPTRIYVKALLPLIEKGLIHGISHITGGGLVENLPRMFDDNLQAVVDSTSWPKAPIFKYLTELGKLSKNDCFETFNMGLGMVLAIEPSKLQAVESLLKAENEQFYQIGKLVERPQNEAKIEIK